MTKMEKIEATEAQAAPAQDTPPAAPVRGNPGARRRGLTILAVIVLIAAIVWAVFHFLLAAPEQETDDAYVAGDVVAITARDPGTMRVWAWRSTISSPA